MFVYTMHNTVQQLCRQFTSHNTVSWHLAMRKLCQLQCLHVMDFLAVESLHSLVLSKVPFGIGFDPHFSNEMWIGEQIYSPKHIWRWCLRISDLCQRIPQSCTKSSLCSWACTTNQRIMTMCLLFCIYLLHILQVCTTSFGNNNWKNPKFIIHFVAIFFFTKIDPN